MKKTVLMCLTLLLTAVLCAGCVDGNSGTEQEQKKSADSSSAAMSGIVKTGGSTSVEKVMNALIYQFKANNGQVTINYEMNGSGDGIKNTISGMYEIGHSSRELKTDGSEDGLDAVAYAIDGIAIVVNKGNAADALTKAQVKDIYTGKIKNWKEVGGKDAPITVITREPGSGTRSAFAEIIGLETKDKDGKAVSETAIVANANVNDSTGAIQNAVIQNVNAIGYMSFSDVDASKVNTIKYEDVSISTAALKDGTYKLKREFFVLTKKGAALSPAAKGFIDFILSAEGQKIVADNKLLPIK